jgi:hypothetical protein
MWITLGPFLYLQRSVVIESVVFEHLHHYLLESQLLSQTQFGFRKNHSTTDALLCIQKLL